MTRPVDASEADLDAETGEGVHIRLVRREGAGLPDEDDLRTVHDILESAFADHFNSHEETFDEFLYRLREDPGHRWDHWWIAELVDGDTTEPAGVLVGSVSEGTGQAPAGSYVEYIGVLQSAIANPYLASQRQDLEQAARAIGARTDVVHLGLDHDLFAPMAKTAARRLLGLPQDKTIVAMGAFDVADRWKGGPLFQELHKALLGRSDVAVILLGLFFSLYLNLTYLITGR